MSPVTKYSHSKSKYNTSDFQKTLRYSHPMCPFRYPQKWSRWIDSQIKGSHLSLSNLDQAPPHFPFSFIESILDDVELSWAKDQWFVCPRKKRDTPFERCRPNPSDCVRLCHVYLAKCVGLLERLASLPLIFFHRRHRRLKLKKAVKRTTSNTLNDGSRGKMRNKSLDDVSISLWWRRAAPKPKPWKTLNFNDTFANQ